MIALQQCNDLISSHRTANLKDPTIARVLAARAQSELLRAVASVRSDGGVQLALGNGRLRALYQEEIPRLESLGNTAEDWSRVRVGLGFDWRRIKHSSFHGDVILGGFARQLKVAEGLQFPAGIYNSTLANCVIGDDTLVRDVRLLVNYVVGPNCLLLNCGQIVCDSGTAFGNGILLPLGIESGGRDVQIYADIDIDVAATIARSRSRRDLLKAYARAVADYAAEAGSSRGIIERGVTLCNTPALRNTYVGPGTAIDGPTLIADSTLLSSEKEPVRIESGACVTRSLLQWGSGVTTLAIVERSVLTEHSHVERHGKVTDSILGPNTGVGEGEVTACLVGPFVGFHHQALLIAALWPEGKGNVAYGANVGSNHTTKAPDQEIWPGEGLFLGLGVNIKFPADFSQAPYSVIASGVTTLPQKVLFPFSLLNTPASVPANLSPAYNEILPGWVLAQNLYALKRNEKKYQARNKARRIALTFEVFRPDTIDLVRDACSRLEAISQVQEVYTEREIKGLGKNFLREPARQSALAAYRFAIRYYALLGLMETVQATLSERPTTLNRLLITPGDRPRWEHQRQLLVGELGVTDILAALRQLPEVLELVARNVEQSKARDDERGPAIILDYADVHPPVESDPFVRQTWDETRRLQGELQQLLALLEVRQQSQGGFGRTRHDHPERRAVLVRPGIVELLPSA
jgi:NDP-sugar pyrophosphorylase family protein